MGILGIGISILGYFFLGYISNLVVLVGLVFILLGLFSFSGFSLSEKLGKYKSKSDPVSVVIFGIVFGLGGIILSPCNGPILLGIAGLTLLEGVSGIIMFFAYIIGLIIPLLILSFFFDKYSAIERISKILRPRKIGKLYLSLPNMIAGSIFIVLGFLFVIYQSTAFLSSFTIDIIPNIVVSLQYYNIPPVNIISSIIFTLSLLFIIYLIHSRQKR